MTSPRTRLLAVAGSMALTMSLAVAPAALAQDDPPTPVNDVLTAFAEARYADASAHFCAEMEDGALGGLAQIEAMAQMGMGYDLDLLFGALAVDVSGLEVGVLEETADDAVVGVEGTIEVGFDEDGLIAFMAAMFSTEDEPLDEDAIRGMLPMLMPQVEAMVGGSVDVDEEVAVVREDGVWQVCDDLSSLGDALASALGTPGVGPSEDMPDGTAEEGMAADDAADEAMPEEDEADE